MFKSQKQNKILLYFFSGLFLIACNTAFCDGKEAQLQQADSLFKAKKFTQAYNIYEELHTQGSFTPSMYLKMAYIKEGLNDISSAMYYLNQYYYSTFDKRALKKMELMAEEHHLSGYEYEDFEFFQSMVLKNSHWLQLVLVSACLLLLASLIYKKISTGAGAKGTAIALAIVAALFLLYINVPILPDYAIIKNNEVFMMENPSAASDLVTTVKEGNKLKVMNAGEVWVKIKYQDRVGYIREHNLLMMTPSDKIY